jgi:2'-5' RNA ligase
VSESLYFIAVVPPLAIQEEITHLKHVVAEKFGSKHALNAPPHITLHMPFKWKEKKISKLHTAIDEINADLQPFNVELQGFDFFEPRVVFVHVVQNDSLNSLQALVVDRCRKKLKLDNGNYKDRPFHPHVTIAFRDLRKRTFHEAKAYFEKRAYSKTFKAERVQLLKHDGKKWNILN